MEGIGWRLRCGECRNTTLQWLTRKGCYVCLRCKKTPRYILDDVTGFKLSSLVRHHYLQIPKEVGNANIPAPEYRKVEPLGIR